MFEDINYAAILVTSVAAFIVGALWYSPVMFGNKWVKLNGWSAAEMKKNKESGMVKEMIINFISTVITVFVLSYVLDTFNVTDLEGALTVAFWLWLGFMSPLALGPILWENKKPALFFLNGAYWLATILVMSAILVSWPA